MSDVILSNFFNSLIKESSEVNDIKSLPEPITIKLYRAGNKDEITKIDQSRSGYYPGLYFYDNKKLCGSHLCKNVPNREIYSIVFTGRFYKMGKVNGGDVLKNSVVQIAGREYYSSGSGYPEARYLMKLGYDGINRGNEYIIFPQSLLSEKFQSFAKGVLAGSLLFPTSLGNIDFQKKYDKQPIQYTQIQNMVKNSVKPNIGKSVKMDVKKMNTVNNSIANMVAKTLWAEARGEGKVGIDAVASVINNRAKGRATNVRKVIRPIQFESWNKGEPKVNIVSDEDQKIWNYCLELGKQIATNTFKPTGNWTHFYNPLTVKKQPKWSINQPFDKIGKQHFLKVK